MFSNKREIEDLKTTVKELKDRLYKIEVAIAPFRVGDFPPYYWSSLSLRDPRPEVTQTQAIRMLLDHCGVEFKKIDGTPERIVLEKKPKAQRNK